MVSCEIMRKTFGLASPQNLARFTNIVFFKPVPLSLEGLYCLYVIRIALELSFPAGWLSLAVCPDDFHSPSLASVMEKP